MMYWHGHGYWIHDDHDKNSFAPFASFRYVLFGERGIEVVKFAALTLC